MDLLEVAAKECLENSQYISHDIDLIIYSGVYRSEFLSEPAVAAMLAKQLDLNAKLQDQRRTFAFDVLNGGIGFFNALTTAMNFIRNGDAKAVMVATAEVENNRDKVGTTLLGLNETAAVVILEGTHLKQGFGEFMIKNYLDDMEDRVTNLSWKADSGMSFLDHSIAPESEARYLSHIETAVNEYLTKNGDSLADYSAIFPPQISPEFCRKMQESTLFANVGVVNVFELCATLEDGDLLTSSIPFALKEALDARVINPGEKVLLVGAGAGIQVGCMSYQF